MIRSQSQSGLEATFREGFSGLGRHCSGYRTDRRTSLSINGLTSARERVGRETKWAGGGLAESGLALDQYSGIWKRLRCMIALA